MKKNGISLISLIITIIVIIILAAIVIFTGLNTPDRANLAKFTSEFSDFGTAITNDYAKRYTDYALAKESRTKAQIYYEIAKGNPIAMEDEPVSDGFIEELGIEILPNGIAGNEYYLITNDTNIDGWNKNTSYYASTEEHYITDEGVVFTLPGYRVEENGEVKWYVNEKSYYIDENGFINGEISEKMAQIKIGDKVAYMPIPNTVTTDITKTGADDSQKTTLQTETGKDWRILHKEGSKIYITPGVVNYESPTQGGVVLKGITGYYEGASELNRICKELYSNGKLQATNLTIELLNKACGKTPEPKSNTGFVFYAWLSEKRAAEAENPSGEEKDGVIYKATEKGTNYCFFPENGANITGGKLVAAAETGNAYNRDYRIPERGNPVYVEETCYTYDYSQTIKDIISKSANGWLASPCVRVSASSASFRMYGTDYYKVTNLYLASSNNSQNMNRCGLVPVVCLNATLLGEKSGDTWMIR